MFDHPLGEESFPNIQSELPPVQLHIIPLDPITDHQGEEISTSSSLPPCEEAVDCDKVTPPSYFENAFFPNRIHHHFDILVFIVIKVFPYNKTNLFHIYDDSQISVISN